jgi:two-component system chemotaxis response regulator CheB
VIAWRHAAEPALAGPRPPAPYDLVAIAASLGGLHALQIILAGLPEDFPIPIAVVQHRTAQAPQVLAELLGRRCALAVKLAEEGETLMPGTVYIATPTLHLVVNDNRTISLANGRRIRHVLSSANPLFESAARALGERVIGVVLTGRGNDGTDGVQAIHLAGGLVLAQDRATSRAFSMPHSAIQTGAVDRVLPLDAIGPALVELSTTKPAR